MYDAWTIVSRPVRPVRVVRVVLSRLKCSVTNDMHVTIDLQPVNHCFMTCKGRTSRVKPFTGRICSTVLDKDVQNHLSSETKEFFIPPNSNTFSDWRRTCHVLLVKTSWRPRENKTSWRPRATTTWTFDSHVIRSYTFETVANLFASRVKEIIF